MKKIILLVLGMIFLTNCGNNGNSNSDSVAVAPEKRESFTENPYFKSKDFIVDKDVDEERLNYVKEHEYNTLKEAIKVRAGVDGLKEILSYHEDKIKEIENNTKSKFFLGDFDNIICIYFTPADTAFVHGKIGVVKIPLISVLSLKGDDKPAL